MALDIRYFGWTAFEIVTGDGFRFITDPMLSGAAVYDIPPSIAKPADFKDVDMILVTHVSEDHLGQAFEILACSNAKLVCDLTTRFKALEAGIGEDRIVWMVSGVRYKVGSVYVKALPAAHISMTKLPSGQFLTTQPLSYIVTTEGGERLFFSGDTSISADHKLFGELYKPDIALLGVGGALAYDGQSLVELYPPEAALLAKWFGVDTVIPMHYREDEDRQLADEVSRIAPHIKTVRMKQGDTLRWERSGPKRDSLC